MVFSCIKFTVSTISFFFYIVNYGVSLHIMYLFFCCLGVRQLFLEMRQNPNRVLNSMGFYSSTFGYKMCLRLSLTTPSSAGAVGGMPVDLPPLERGTIYIHTVLILYKLKKKQNFSMKHLYAYVFIDDETHVGLYIHLMQGIKLQFLHISYIMTFIYSEFLEK